MCGIAGLIDPALAADALLARVRVMCSRLTHRGPDDEGYHVAGHAAVGMRRLSIIDIASGQQPIWNEDGTLCIVFNGEVFNYIELRAELEAAGHAFRTRSDTETILHLYEQEGVAGFARLRGQFAVAILDVRTGALVLARDHLGIIPLFYAHDGERLAFASELKALRAIGRGRDISPAAVARFFALRYVPGPETIHPDVRKVRPGAALLFRDGRLEEQVFWSAEAAFARPQLEPGPAALERTTELLREAVALRLRSEVPFGAFLSGGLDSSLVVGLMAERVGQVNTFSVGFARRNYHEFVHSRDVARRFRTAHTEHTVSPAEFEAAFRLFQAHTDEPIGDPAFIPLFCLARRTKERVTVVLSGEGADELFGGYERYRDIVQRFPTLTPDAAAAYLEGCAYFIEEAPLAPEVLAAARPEEGRRRLLDLLARPVGPGVLERLLHFDLVTWMPDNLLVKADRMGMAHSLEVRVPYLDVPLLEHAARLPAGEKVHRSLHRTLFGKRERWTLKHHLKQVAAGVLPRSIVEREKVGFPVPVRRLLRHELRHLVEELPAQVAQDGLLDRARVERLVRRFLEEGKSSWPVWTLLCFEAWRASLAASAAPVEGAV
jgi:asparagine synthase (glutamine-hydrolysing)